MTVEQVLARLRRHPRWLGVAGIVLVAVLSIVLFDRPLSVRIHAGLSDTQYGFWRTVSKIGLAEYWYGLALIGLLVSYVRARAAWTLEGARECRRHVRSWWFMLLSMLLSGAAVHVVKFVSGRIRPEDMLNGDDSRYGFFPFSGEQSFPSGHSQAIWSAMVALSILFPRHRWWFFGIATLVAFSRVATFQHFLADILVGSALGVVITLTLRDRFEKKAPLRLGQAA